MLVDIPTINGNQVLGTHFFLGPFWLVWIVGKTYDPLGTHL